MILTHARATALACLALALAGPRVAAAERLFVRAAGLPSSARGISRVQALAIDTAALAALRGSAQATLTEFPLGADGLATLSVERFEPFTASARAVVMEDTGPRDLSLPDQLYYRGRVDGDASSLVDKLRTPTGMEKLSLTAGAAGAAKAKGKGVNLDMPALGSLATPIQVQLRSAGQCFAAVYSTPILNTTEQFKAKSDPPPP